MHWIALINLETSILIQKRHPNTGILYSERSGDSKTCFYIVEMDNILLIHQQLKAGPCLINNQ